MFRERYVLWVGRKAEALCSTIWHLRIGNMINYSGGQSNRLQHFALCIFLKHLTYQNQKTNFELFKSILLIIVQRCSLTLKQSRRTRNRRCPDWNVMPNSISHRLSAHGQTYFLKLIAEWLMVRQNGAKWLYHLRKWKSRSLKIETLSIRCYIGCYLVWTLGSCWYVVRNMSW